MQHIAIDLGGRKSQVCVRTADGTIVREGKVETTFLRQMLQREEKSRVVVETCTEAFVIADGALEAGHDVRVVPATLVPTLGVGARRTKTDRRDAQILSEVSCRIDLPSVHIPSKSSRERKTMCGMREGLIGARTMLVNATRGWLRASLVKVRTGAVESFVERVQEACREGMLSIPSHVERHLTMIDALSEQIGTADRELKELANNDPVCVRLMTTPGVGPVTSVRFVAALDQIERFAGAHDAEAYLGLVPGERSSSERQQRTGITKAGSPALRRVLVQAAWAARRFASRDPLVLWCLEVEKRRGARVAVTALARKLAGILYAIWRDGTTYDPRRGAEKSYQEVEFPAAA